MIKETEKKEKRKIAVIGSGFVGASIAYALVLKDLAGEIVLIDVRPEVALGEAIDIRHGIPELGTAKVYSGDYCDCADCDLIVITAGRNRRPGEVRLDLIADNLKIARGVADGIKKYYTKGVILVVANPVDIITCKLTEWLDLPDGMVFGTGCMLDTSRFRAALADYFGVCTCEVNGDIIGEHGETQLPAWSRVTVCDQPVDEYAEANNKNWNDEIKAEMAKNVKGLGAKIIANKGRTHFGIATSVCYLADAVLNDKQITECVSSVLNGEYGMENVAISVPSVIGAGGVQKRLIKEFSEKENEQFLASAMTLQNTLASLAQ